MRPMRTKKKIKSRGGGVEKEEERTTRGKSGERVKPLEVMDGSTN